MIEERLKLSKYLGLFFLSAKFATVQLKLTELMTIIIFILKITAFQFNRGVRQRFQTKTTKYEGVYMKNICMQEEVEIVFSHCLKV